MNFHSQILSFAKDGRKSDLKELLFQGACIDEFAIGTQCTPAQKLAEENHIPAVNLLLQLGANVKHIARGFALSGKAHQVEHYKRLYGLADSELVEYYAMGGHFEIIFRDFKQDEATLEHLIRGSARGHHSELVNQFVRKHPQHALAAIEGYMQSGNTAQCRTMESLYLNSQQNVKRLQPLPPHLELNDIYCVSALTNKLYLIREFLYEEVQPYKAIYYAALGGQESLIDTLIACNETTLGLFHRNLLTGLAAGGHTMLIHKYLANPEFNESLLHNYLAEGFAQLLQHRLARKYYAPNKCTTHLWANGYLKSGLCNSQTGATAILCHMAEDQHLQELANAIPIAYSVLSRSRHIREKMQTEGLCYEAAYALTKPDLINQVFFLRTKYPTMEEKALSVWAMLPLAAVLIFQVGTQKQLPLDLLSHIVSFLKPLDQLMISQALRQYELTHRSRDSKSPSNDSRILSRICSSSV